MNLLDTAIFPCQSVCHKICCSKKNQLISPDTEQKFNQKKEREREKINMIKIGKIINYQREEHHRQRNPGNFTLFLFNFSIGLFRAESEEQINGQRIISGLSMLNVTKRGWFRCEHYPITGSRSKILKRIWREREREGGRDEDSSFLTCRRNKLDL